MNVKAIIRLLIAVGLYSVALLSHAVQLPDVLEDPLKTKSVRLKLMSDLAWKPVDPLAADVPLDPLSVQCPVVWDAQALLSLDLAVDLALCNNPELTASWANTKAQTAAVGQAQAAYLPTISGALGAQNSQTRYPDNAAFDTSKKGTTANAALNWRLFDFGARSNNRAAAEQLLKAALASHNSVLQKTLSGTVGAYFDVMTAQAAFEARADMARLAQETVEVTERKESKGAAARSDTLQAKTAWAKAKLAEQRAQGEHHKAMAALRIVMGLSNPVQALQLPSMNAAAQTQSIADLSAWLKMTQEQHPAIQEAQAHWQAAQNKIDSTRAEGLPTVDFTGNFYKNGYPNQSLQSMQSNITTVGVSLNVPLFDGFANTYKVRAAQAQAQEAEAKLRATENQTAADVVKAHADAVAAWGSLSVSADLLDAAEAANESSQQRYAKGATDILELLAVQSELANAKQERIRCLAEWQFARLKLMASAGRLGRGKF